MDVEASVRMRGFFIFYTLYNIASASSLPPYHVPPASAVLLCCAMDLSFHDVFLGGFMGEFGFASTTQTKKCVCTLADSSVA